MSRIDRLIAEHCPQGVEHKPLGDLGEFIRGQGLQKKDLLDSGVPAIHYGQIHTQYGVWTTKTKSFTSQEAASKLRHAHRGDLLIATTSEDDESVGKATAWLGTTDVVLSGDAYIYRHSLDAKYAAYFFQSAAFQMQKQRFISGAKVRRLSGDSMSKIRVPVPPLEVQREIVRVLDQFSQLEAELETELEAELEARRVQNEALRSRVLSSGDPPTVGLGEIAEFRYGLTATAAEAGSHRFIRITDILPTGKLSPNGAKYVGLVDSGVDDVVKVGDILMARTGATFGKTMLFDSPSPAAYASFLIRIRFAAGTLLPEYYWHFAQSALYWDQVNALASRGGQPQFNGNALKRVRVPVPPIQDQERIVGVLRSLDLLVNDLSIGLPAELAARRKQYEYYRDKLLTFEEAPA